MCVCVLLNNFHRLIKGLSRNLIVTLFYIADTHLALIFKLAIENRKTKERKKKIKEKCPTDHNREYIVWI